MLRFFWRSIWNLKRIGIDPLYTSLMDHNLQRFLDAQQAHYQNALSELRNGYKQSHWMWFIFPQIAGLGFSETARYYAIKNIEEARAYLDHELLGERLITCTKTVLTVQNHSLSDIFGSPDDLKFKSSMTLFEHVAIDNDVFSIALERYCDGRRDDKTLQIIQQ